MESASSACLATQLGPKICEWKWRSYKNTTRWIATHRRDENIDSRKMFSLVFRSFLNLNDASCILSVELLVAPLAIIDARILNISILYSLIYSNLMLSHPLNNRAQRQKEILILVKKLSRFDFVLSFSILDDDLIASMWGRKFNCLFCW